MHSQKMSFNKKIVLLSRSSFPSLRSIYNQSNESVCDCCAKYCQPNGGTTKHLTFSNTWSQSNETNLNSIVHRRTDDERTVVRR